MNTSWEPGAYLAFADERARPFFDLLARVTVRAPRRVVDLGCGAGALFPALRARFPAAEITGVDTFCHWAVVSKGEGRRGGGMLLSVIRA